jgi:hypothetical protein
MAQSGYTPIQLYYSTTASTAPSVGNLANGELAINITDGKLYYKDNSSSLQVIAWKTTPAIAGGTGQTTYTTGDLLYASATNTLSKLAASTNGYVLTLSGGVPTWSPNTGGVTSFSGGSTGLTPNTATTGAISLGGTLLSGYGGTGFSTYAAGDLIYASATNTLSKLTAGTNGYVLTLAAGVPTWGAPTGATGGGSNQAFYINDKSVTVNYTIPTGKNAMSAGPITIAGGVVVTVPSGSKWTVVG